MPQTNPQKPLPPGADSTNRSDHAATGNPQKPLPPITRLTKPFWDGCREGELRIQFCNICDRPWFPPADNCPRCLMDDWEWRTVSGHGTVWSWIQMHQRYFPGWQPHEYPIPIALIQLEEGPYLYSNLVNISPNEIRCDLPVEVAFHKTTDTITLPHFQPRR